MLGWIDFNDTSQKLHVIIKLLPPPLPDNYFKTLANNQIFYNPCHPQIAKLGSSLWISRVVIFPGLKFVQNQITAYCVTGGRYRTRKSEGRGLSARLFKRRANSSWHGGCKKSFGSQTTRCQETALPGHFLVSLTLWISVSVMTYQFVLYFFSWNSLLYPWKVVKSTSRSVCPENCITPPKNWLGGWWVRCLFPLSAPSPCTMNITEGKCCCKGSIPSLLMPG